MEHHSWTLIQRDGEALTGVDDFPPEMAKLNCKCFILRLAGLVQGSRLEVNLGGLRYAAAAPDLEFEVPEGFALVFKRRNNLQAIVNSKDPMQIVGQEWKYIVGVVPLRQERCEQSSTAHPP
jgi:hypothetical protein